ncbi:hypothetical protein QFZ35_000228 [Arthrobacter ulcerisalmonis]|nr:hypothetical protein [Arthrobacter ulcerisalmonis]
MAMAAALESLRLGADVCQMGLYGGLRDIEPPAEFRATLAQFLSGVRERSKGYRTLWT